MWWECSECGACLECVRAPGRCAECGQAALFVAADQVVAGVSEVMAPRELWMQRGFALAMMPEEEVSR